MTGLVIAAGFLIAWIAVSFVVAPLIGKAIATPDDDELSPFASPSLLTPATPLAGTSNGDAASPPAAPGGEAPHP